MTLHFITAFQKVDIDKTGLPDLGASRVWGFYQSRDRALEVLHKNITDIWEYLYNYAVLEEFEEGISGCTHNRQFFKYDRSIDGYVEIPEPEGFKPFIGFALG